MEGELMPVLHRGGVSIPLPGGPGRGVNLADPSTFTMERAQQNLFARCGRKEPHWKDVIYGARHATSIIGAQVHLLAEIRALVPGVLEFEVRPDKWVKAGEHVSDDAAVNLAIAVATRTWRMLKSENGSRAVPIRSAAEVLGSVGEGYGIESTGKTGKPAVAVVHTKAVTVNKDGSGLWHRREGGKPEPLRADRFRRLFVEDETYVDDCTSPFRWLASDVAHLEIITAAIRAGGTADLVSRGLIWAPRESQNTQVSWIADFYDIVEQVRSDPTVLGGLVPFPVTTGGVAPQFVSLGSIQETLIRAYELLVDVIARGSPLPAKLVKDGPGEADAYADAFLNRAFLQYHVAPLLQQNIYPDLLCWWMVPRLESNAQFAGTGVEADRFRVVPDIATIANKPDSRKEALAAHLAGVVRKAFVGDQLGASEDDLLREGSDEWDEWLAARTATAANAANGFSGRSAPDGDVLPVEPEQVGSGTELGPRFASLDALW